MKDDLKTFKDTVNSALNDIHMTDELKDKTFRACKSHRKIKPVYAITALTAFMVFATAGYNHFFPNKINKMYVLNMITTEEKLHNIESLIKDSIINPNKDSDNLKNKTSDTNYAFNKDNPAKSNIIKDLKNKTDLTKATLNEQDDKTISKDKSTQETTSVNKEDSKDSIEKSPAETTKKTFDTESTLSQPKPNVGLAEEYLGEKLNMPSYVPDDFKLNSINMTTSADKSVNITYNSKDAHININQGKSTTTTTDTEGEKIDINGVEARSCWVESKGELRVTWNKDNTKYTVQGNVPKSALVDVAKSMK